MSSYETFAGVAERQWQYPVIRFIKQAEVPVVPMYFQGSNSRLVQLIEKIKPSYQPVKFPTELLNKRNKVIRVRIGTPIGVGEQKKFVDTYQYGRYLRAKTYSMETKSKLEVKRFFNYSLIRTKQGTKNH